jgi:hypothetical protein
MPAVSRRTCARCQRMQMHAAGRRAWRCRCTRPFPHSRSACACARCAVPAAAQRPSLPALQEGPDTWREKGPCMLAQPDETGPCTEQKVYFDITIGGAPAGRVTMQLETET